jgi:hypothetical protein
VQTNALRFVNHQLYIKTPLLAIIASFCWLIPIATIYPPGALVLGIQTVSLNTRFNVSVFHAKDLMNTANQSTIAEISCEYGEGPPVSPIRMFGPPKFPEAALNPSFLKSCQFVPGSVYPTHADMHWPYIHCRITDTRIRYITNTNLIVGELPRLNPPSGQNSSYSLEFWGTTLDCATKDRILERPVVASNSSATWNVSEPVTEGLSSPTREVSLTQNATFTYRKLGNVDTYQYYPCSGDPIEEPALGDSKSSVLLSDIRVLVPVIETTCHPKLVKYIVAISHGGGVQNITYTIKDGEPAPDYTSEFKDFHGTFEQFVQFSDAITFYLDFASNLNNSPTYTPDITFKSPQGHQKTQSRTLDNRTVVQTCSLQTSISIGKPQLYDQFSIWPLSVFERRLPSDPSHPNAFASKFDPKLATDLLINTTISALTLNDRFDIVNGTESHSFNVYRFEHQLTFFLPYCLALGLAIPTIALGLVALYVHNHGVSAINGGFLQLLMTTTGRTEMEAIIMRGSGTLGGEENVSKELQEMEVRFGELKYNDKTECSSMATSPSLLAYSNSAQEAEELQSEPNQVVNTQDVQYLGEAQQAFYSSVYSNCKSKVRRVGFGTAQDILPTTKA